MFLIIRPGIPFKQQRLFFDETQLEDDVKIFDYDVKDHSSVTLWRSEEIFVKTLTGETLTLDLFSVDTVDTMKEMIRLATGKFKLLFFEFLWNSF